MTLCDTFSDDGVFLQLHCKVCIAAGCEESGCVLNGEWIKLLVCADLLSGVSRQDGYRGEVGAVERERGGKDRMVRTSFTPRLPSHTDMK